MKRKAEVEMHRKVESDKRSKLLDPQWSLATSMDAVTNSTSMGSSYSHVNENEMFSLQSGRKSFRGYNLGVEKYCAELADDRRFEKASKNESITDEEMAIRYSELTGLPRGPNQGRRQMNGGSKSLAPPTTKRNKR
jgi:hypothetical protein